MNYRSHGGLLESKMNGILLNTNTVEEYKAIDINSKTVELLKDKFWELIKSGEWINNTSKLNSFLLVSFANLKQYVYQFWFNSLVVDDSWFSVNVTKSKLLHKAFKNEVDKLDRFKTVLTSYITNQEKDVHYNSPFIVYSEENEKCVGIDELLKNPSNHIILFIDPSPKQPSSIIKNLLFLQFLQNCLLIH